VRVVGDLGAGHTLGRYELLVPIAQGGMAVVWAARMKGTRGFQKIVAVKSMLPSLSEDPQFEEMFLAEAELASRIRHPHVCEILDLGEQDGTLYIVMEWVDGEPLSTLQKAARNKGGIPLAVAARIGLHAALGLHAAHELQDEEGALLGLVHRDVSPQNILVTYTGVVKIVDFGVAKATSGAQDGRTKAGQVKGKVPFMSPEQALGKKVDRRTDVFALGIVLYQMITGKHPFRGDNDMATLHRICDPAPVATVKSVVPTCPDALSDVISKALEKDPAKRFQTMTEMARGLERGVASLVGDGDSTKDQDTAAFVRSVVGERADKRKAAIKEAIRTADERAELRKKNENSGTFAAVTAGALGAQEKTNPSGISEISQVSVKSDANPPISGVTGLPGLGDPRASVTSATSPNVQLPAVEGVSGPPRPKRAAIAIAVGVAAIGIATAAMFLGSGGDTPHPGHGSGGPVSASAGPPTATPTSERRPEPSAAPSATATSEAIPFGDLAPVPSGSAKAKAHPGGRPAAGPCSGTGTGCPNSARGCRR